MQLKPILQAAVLVVLSVSTALGVAEILTRQLFPVYDPSGMTRFVRSPEGVSLGVPNSRSRQWKNTGDFDVAVAFNRYGLRDVKDLKRSTANDIFVVGDSFAFGMGVEENERFSNRVEEITGIPAFNLAIPNDVAGYEKLIQYAERQGAVIRNVIIAICMENDLEDYDRGPDLPETPAVLSLEELKAFLTSRSALYNIATSAIHRHAELARWARKLGLLVDNWDGMNRNSGDERILDSTLRHVGRLTKNRRAIVMIIPSRALWFGGNEAAERRVHEAFADRLRAHRFEVVDPRAAFEGTGNPLRHHFLHDGHWNVDGHRIAAQLLASRIRVLWPELINAGR